MQGSVVDATSLKQLMGWNDYENDPNSLGKVRLTLLFMYLTTLTYYSLNTQAKQRYHGP